MMKKDIQVVPYDPNWPSLFEKEADLLKQALGHNCLAIHHIGSTSVPGLAAKPKIDVLIVVQDAFVARGQLEKVNIEYRGEFNIPLHSFFRKRGDVDLNIHVYEEDHPEIELNLCFRDSLRVHCHQREAYGRLKETLLQDASSLNKETSSFPNYTLRKGDFIREILRQAGFDRLRVLRCNDSTEWQAAQRFRDTCFGPDKLEDPYTWTFHHAEHAHLVLYHGTEIMGYAHIQFWPDQRAAMRMIAVVEEEKRNHNAGSQFLAFIEKWLKILGIESLHVESRQSSLSFYVKNGYCPMSFDDPDNYTSHPDDSPMGKIL